MSVAKVLRLDEYRDRRLHRLELARALSRVDPARATLFEHLVEITDLTGADRVAAVWVDEYGPGLVHPHVVLDLLCDRPRRAFAPEPLHRAWESGVPGSYDQAQDSDEPSSGTIAIALGSDGSRGWFVVAESVARRSAFESTVRDRLMFLVGECSAIVLHRDLDLIVGTSPERRFAGWQILQDLESRVKSGDDQAAISRRFLLGRLLCTLVEEELSMSADGIAEHVARIRAEIDLDGISDDSERDGFAGVLDALVSEDFADLPAAVLRLGGLADGAGHDLGALELYRCAYAVASQTGVPRLAVEAARKCGRVLRRQASWHEADRWYGIAVAVSQRMGLHQLAARSLAGLSLVKRERGNLPAAREGLLEAERVAKLSGDRDTLGSVYHDLMGLEHQAGDLDAALRLGWKAVNTYESPVAQTRGMAGLAGTLAAAGDLQAAEDAYTVVLHTSSEHYYRVYAHDALAYIAARRGDAESFTKWAARCDALDWESGARNAKAEILYFRGLSYQALGMRQEAQAWLKRAAQFAEGYGFNQLSFQAEEALERLRSEERAEPDVLPIPAAPPAIRTGLRAMRADLVGAGA